MNRYCTRAALANIPRRAPSTNPRLCADQARSPVNKMPCRKTIIAPCFPITSQRYTTNGHRFHSSLQCRQLSDFAKSEYIHPLSQIVLEHLQSTHSDWVQRMGLDKGLEVKKDGTFVLRFDNVQKKDGDDVESIW